MSGPSLIHLSGLPDDLAFSEGQTPTPEKVTRMLEAMNAAGYSQRGLSIEGEFTSQAVWFAQAWAGECAAHAALQGRWAELEARELRVRNIVMDASYAAAVDTLGLKDEGVKAATMEALGSMTLLLPRLQELATSIRQLVRGETNDLALNDLFPASKQNALHLLIRSAQVLEEKVLKAAEAQKATP